ncbi:MULTISPECIES: hypothetical protein [Microbacterium]|uniref:hypothetical protein n=1 Tax=Microbacterium TaxID=33882 RepID=UPI000CCE5E80|nr:MULTISPECIES: hypothetical protein [Microbacterium]MDZ5145807.1 hypothetical protein [Microbacterium testaceum]PNW09806.1 hypothetical protein C1632_05250 [Microbacterium testaceum]REC99815.1 hypothetical protein DEU35_0791 [Microbacterium sp. AG157]WJS91472.1 hypothetical protein NYQ11_02655 [Microbacterium testaceum]
MTEREETQDAPVMDGATDAGAAEKKEGAQQQRAADAAVHEDDDPAQHELEDDIRSIRGYGEDR